MKVLQINTSVNSGSTGRIAEDIGRLLISRNDLSYIAFARAEGKSVSSLIKIGNKAGIYGHVLRTRLLDGHGFGSYHATEKFLKEVRRVDPDIIHLHNIHGYYIHIGLLFSYLKEVKKPVVWTLHDCWSFTGHCSHFDRVNCEKWKTQCYSCPLKKRYPASWFLDRSKSNYLKKKELFSSLDSLSVVAPSQWLADHLKNSFLKDSDIRVINNGIDLSVFRPDVETQAIRQKYGLENKSVILGVANVWTETKGLNDLLELNQSLRPDEQLVLVGMNKQQLKVLPLGIIGIERTESVDELARFYALAEVYVNPTYLDNFPTTNIEALACGTPVITYKTGGSAEAIDDKCGIALQKGDIAGLRLAIDKMAETDRAVLRVLCAERVKQLYNKDDRFEEYLSLYRKLIEKQ